jgi:hypothetical protein
MPPLERALFAPYPANYPPGSPAEVNSPTRYEQYQGRPSRDRNPTWKVVEAGWANILKRVGREPVEEGGALESSRVQEVRY